MSIREDFKDIILVDEVGRIEYFTIFSTDFFDLKPEELIGTKAHQHYNNLDDESSTLMRAIHYGESKTHYVQELATSKGKVVSQESDTFCVRNQKEVIGAIEFAYYDESQYQFPPEIQKDGTALYNPDLSDIIGRSRAMEDIKKKLKKVVDLEAPILLTGETGTGKEMAARAIHNSSNRRTGEFVYVNCGALPENLIESILFGTKRGSFTDAAEREGLFLAADKGTIFLDEIQAMPAATQGKILRVIEEKRIRPIGAEDEISVDVRIIASCNLDTETLIHTDTLRKDLYFRLSVIQFELPALRNRKEDILPIAEYYIEQFNNTLGDRQITGMDSDVMDFFQEYNWPGNVRELRNTIEGAFYTIRGNQITMDAIEERFDVRETESVPVNLIAKDFLESGYDLKDYMEHYERRCITDAIKNSGSDLKTAAKALGLSSQMMKYNMKKLDIELEGTDD